MKIRRGISYMSEFYEQVKERFIRYVKVDTQSQAGSSTAPSTMKQKKSGADA